MTDTKSEYFNNTNEFNQNKLNENENPDELYMKLALNLAKKGLGYVNPNPMVGAVIVRDGTILGSGYHERFGELHAERRALASCKESVEGATMYVTLEPCCHYGKTPPCTEAIIAAKIKKVVIGSSDPNPLVAGKGATILKEHGIEVVCGMLKEECDKLNEVFFHFIQTKTPYVVLKYAMTMDGKIATSTGKSKWITGEVARNHVHASRHRYSAIMVGVGTVLQDDPRLTCRIPGGNHPIRIICDTNLRTPLHSQIVKTAHDIPTYLATAVRDQTQQAPFLRAGIQLLTLPKKEEHIDLTALMNVLGEKNIDSIYLEGGATLNYSALITGIVHKIHAYIAPKLFGGETAKTPVGGSGVTLPSDAFLLTNQTITNLGEDVFIESEVLKNVHRNC